VCERIPYLILPVRQLSREPFGSHRSGRRSAEAPRASSRARRRARLDPNHPPKRRERAVGPDAGPVSIRSSAEASRASRRARRQPVSIRSSAEAPRVSRRARRRTRLDPTVTPKRYAQAVRQPPDMRRTEPLRQSVTGNPLRKPLGELPSARAGGRFQYRTEPLRLFTVNPLTVGEFGRMVMGGVIPV